MKLIDADTMYDCKTCYHDNNGKCRLGTFGCDHGEAYRPAFSKLEIIDAVPVVRCKYCRFSMECGEEFTICTEFRDEHGYYRVVGDYDYCSFALRREDA